MKIPARPSAAAKHWDFEQEETEKTEVIALLSVLSVDSCWKKCAQPAHVLTYCSAKEAVLLCAVRSFALFSLVTQQNGCWGAKKITDY